MTVHKPRRIPAPPSSHRYLRVRLRGQRRRTKVRSRHPSDSPPRNILLDYPKHCSTPVDSLVEWCCWCREIGFSSICRAILSGHWNTHCAVLLLPLRPCPVQHRPCRCYSCRSAYEEYTRADVYCHSCDRGRSLDIHQVTRNSIRITCFSTASPVHERLPGPEHARLSV